VKRKALHRYTSQRSSEDVACHHPLSGPWVLARIRRSPPSNLVSFTVVGELAGSWIARGFQSPSNGCDILVRPAIATSASDAHRPPLHSARDERTSGSMVRSRTSADGSDQMSSHSSHSATIFPSRHSHKPSSPCPQKGHKPIERMNPTYSRKAVITLLVVEPRLRAEPVPGPDRGFTTIGGARPSPAGIRASCQPGGRVGRSRLLRPKRRRPEPGRRGRDDTIRQGATSGLMLPRLAVEVALVVPFHGSLPLPAPAVKDRESSCGRHAGPGLTHRGRARRRPIRPTRAWTSHRARSAGAGPDDPTGGRPRRAKAATGIPAADPGTRASRAPPRSRDRPARARARGGGARSRRSRCRP